MKFNVAITTSDGKLINQHFGHCSEFSIVEVDAGSGEWKFVEKRKTTPTCQEFSHNPEHVMEVAKMLSDCLYLLTLRIGAYPSAILQNYGITCLEAPELISESLERLCSYYKINHI
jgi:predicted Fe-Mo cluster-binding NifX family protein